MHSAYAGEMWYIATVFFQPKTLAEALQHKADLRQGGIFIAGGTDLVVLMNHGKEAPEHLIDLSHIQSLTEIRPRDGLIELGGNVTFAQCARLPVQCLSQAALSVGGPGTREIGTLAGNLATCLRSMPNWSCGPLVACGDCGSRISSSTTARLRCGRTR